MVKTGTALKRYCAVLRMLMLMLVLISTVVRLLGVSRCLTLPTMQQKLAYFSWLTFQIWFSSGSLPGASNATEQLAMK